MSKDKDHALRLTLRTLLAYLDDTLDPLQAKQIGQKLAESDTAQELVARIKQVIRRRRLASPPDDPNTIAEYLDNELTSEQLTEVEQTFLGSDSHLAEIASCHQILTIVLGEPAKVPPTAKQRMYALVKGRESIPYRKPQEVAPTAQDQSDELSDTEEMLRLGVPPVERGQWRKVLLYVAGVAAIFAGLVVAIWQLLQGTSTNEPLKNGALVQADTTRKKPPPKKDTGVVEETTKKEPITAKNGTKVVKNSEPTTSKKKDTTVKPPVDVPLEPPSVQIAALGHYVAPEPPRTSVVLQFEPKDKEWVRLVRQMKQAERIHSARPLVALPGYKGLVQLDNGMRLTLWGNLMQYNLHLEGVVKEVPHAPRFESVVTLHQHSVLDADLTLHRGGLILTNAKGERPLRVRVRFANPTNPEHREIWDITLDTKAEAMVNRKSYFPPGEPFFEDRKRAERAGPVAEMDIFAIRGQVHLRTDHAQSTLYAPVDGTADFCWMQWHSRRGWLNKGLPRKLDKMPDWLYEQLYLPKDIDAKLRDQVQETRDQMLAAAVSFSSDLSDKKIDLGLKKALQSAKGYKRMLAVHCYAAIDDLPSLVDALSDDKSHEIRYTAIDTLKYWMSYERDNEYLLHDQLLATRYTPIEAKSLMWLFHDLTDEQLNERGIMDTLIDYLVAPKLVIRDLAHSNLIRRIPEGLKIGYSAVAPADQRARGRDQWHKFYREWLQGGPKEEDPGKKSR
jgi:hypothetical protein